MGGEFYGALLLQVAAVVWCIASVFLFYKQMQGSSR
jgi:hypothetical protein